MRSIEGKVFVGNDDAKNIKEKACNRPDALLLQNSSKSCLLGKMSYLSCTAEKEQEAIYILSIIKIAQA